jgi:hypothetical protein
VTLPSCRAGRWLAGLVLLVLALGGCDRAASSADEDLRRAGAETLAVDVAFATPGSGPRSEGPSTPAAGPPPDGCPGRSPCARERSTRSAPSSGGQQAAPTRRVLGLRGHGDVVLPDPVTSVAEVTAAGFAELVEVRWPTRLSAPPSAAVERTLAARSSGPGRPTVGLSGSEPRWVDSCRL